MAVLIASYAFSQGPALQQNLSSLKEAAAQNKQRLMQYQWTETQQITLKGEPKGAKQFLCQYGPGGQVVKTPIGVQDAQAPQGGRLKQRIVEKKKEEMQDYMGDVKSILALYVPPDPQKMQRAFQEKNVSFTPGNGTVDLTFKNYAQPGDQMTVTFNQQAKKISNIDVNTYTQSPDQVVTLAVQFASLPDGTNYAQQSILNAKAKNLVVTTTNSNYQKLAP
ncbi:MAG TPA: hypothetical protein VMD98_08030 [Bryocella sp.]|nr:hypothetical protein [Bryocella sp.]